MALTKKKKNHLQTTYGDWALVTGASSGIGREIAKVLASAGLNLIINARNENELDSLGDTWKKQYGIEVMTLASDLSTREGVQHVIAQTKGYEIGLLVASAGFGTSGEFVENSVEQENIMLRLNCEAVLLLTHEFANRFKAQGKGGIVLLSSIVAFQGTPYAAHYAATKAYIQTLAEGIAIELKKYDIDVLAAAPGPVESGFGNRADMEMNGAMSAEKIAPSILRTLGKSSTVVPGALSKFLTYSLRMLPRFGKIKVMKAVMGGMTKHQRT